MRFMTIGNRVLSILKEKGLKQKDLAEFIGTGTSTVNGWKEANRNPSAELILPICEFLDVSTEFLLTGTNADQSRHELSANDEELLDLFRQLPERNQVKLIGYVERMIEELFGEVISSGKNNKDNYDWVDWDKIMNEKPSVAAEETTKKTGTTNSAK